MKTHCSNLLGICCIACSLCGCAEDPRVQEAQARLLSNGMRESDKLYCRFVPIDPAHTEETIESFTVDDKDTIRALADSLSVTSLVAMNVEQIEIAYHVEIAWDDNKGFWLLGDDMIVFYDDFSLDRSFPSGYTMADMKPEFWKTLNERCELESRLHSWEDRLVALGNGRSDAE